MSNFHRISEIASRLARIEEKRATLRAEDVALESEFLRLAAELKTILPDGASPVAAMTSIAKPTEPNVSTNEDVTVSPLVETSISEPVSLETEKLIRDALVTDEELALFETVVTLPPPGMALVALGEKLRFRRGWVVKVVEKIRAAVYRLGMDADLVLSFKRPLVEGKQRGLYVCSSLRDPRTARRRMLHAEETREPGRSRALAKTHRLESVPRSRTVPVFTAVLGPLCKQRGVQLPHFPSDSSLTTRLVLGERSSVGNRKRIYTFY